MCSFLVMEYNIHHLPNTNGKKMSLEDCGNASSYTVKIINQTTIPLPANKVVVLHSKML